MLGQSKSRENGKLEKERVLNVFREALPEDETLTVQDLEDKLPVGERTIQGWVRELEEEGSLVLENKGKPNHWRLADSEPEEPVYKEEYAQACRTANRASELGNKIFMVGVSILASIGIITTSNIYSIPYFQDVDIVVIAGLVGIFGAVMLFLAFIAYLLAATLPQATRWYLDGTLPDDQQ